MAAELTNITVEYDCPIRASLKDGRLVTILAAFALVLPQILTMFVETVLLAYAQVIMDAPHKPFACARCGNDQQFIWKHTSPDQSGCRDEFPPAYFTEAYFLEANSPIRPIFALDICMTCHHR